MNAQLTNAPPSAVSANGDADAFTSVTIWTGNDYFLQVHFGHFDTWEEAEDFASYGELRLEERSNALFLIGPQGASFITDQAMTIYRNYGSEFTGGSTYDLTFDDLIEVAHVETMRLCAIGSQPVRRGRPVVAVHMEPIAFQPVSASNDSAE
jgi:hypothetical protein